MARGAAMLKKIKLWRTRIVLKLILSRLPIKYKTWAKFGVFKHGAMDNYLYAWQVLVKHSSQLKNSSNWKGLELGPGDGMLSSLLAPAAGSSGLTLLDADDFAHRDLELYRQNIENFSKTFPRITLPTISFDSDINDMLLSVNGVYLSKGLESLKILNDSSYDLIFSQAVLEHIRQHEFEQVIKECYRLLSPNGVMSHVIDFKDHLGGGLNNMRFSSNLWEREWFAQESGFYTNRIKLSRIILISEKIGFNVKIKNSKYWDKLPIKKSQLAIEFHNLSHDDLITSGSHLIMQK